MIIDLSRPENDRIADLKVNTGSAYEYIDDEQIYKIVTVNYLANGGDGYEISQHRLSHSKGKDYCNVIVCSHW